MRQQVTTLSDSKPGFARSVMQESCQMKTPMAIEDHLEMANLLKAVEQYLTNIHIRCAKHHRKGHPLMDRFNDLFAAFDIVKHILDAEYHSIATNNEFKRHGNIYYTKRGS